MDSITKADLVRLGFHQEASRSSTEEWFSKDTVRVVLAGEEGTEVFEFEPGKTGNSKRTGVLVSQARFSQSTPKAAVLAFVFALHGGG